MLVLSRKESESVFVGDEVKLTVEAIHDSGGQRVSGAKVRLGFQLPDYVAIVRDECRDRQADGVHRSGSARPARSRPGSLVTIADACVRLRILVPHKIPVCCNGQPSIGSDALQGRPDAAAMQEHRMTCHREDRITICNNMTVVALDFQRFVFCEESLARR